MLKPEDFEGLYGDFDRPPATFDCGKKCSPYNDGAPFCCDSGWAVPIGYVQEWKFLKQRTKLWHRYRPTKADGLKIVEELDPKYSVAIECRGVQHCERHNRSISCRTFPFEPYLDKEGTLLGLIYNRVLEDKCYLVDRPSVVTKQFIRSSLQFWERLFEIHPSEREVYTLQSRIQRQQMSRRNKPLIVLTLDGPYRAALRGGKLIKPVTPREPRYRPKV